MQLLKEAVPGLKALTVFWNVSSAKHWPHVKAVAAKLKLDVFGVEFKKLPYDFERGYAAVPEKYRKGLLILNSPLFGIPERRSLPDFALRHRLPVMFVFRDYVAAGGLMSYGADMPAMAARAADYVDLIAKGADPGTLPIALPPKFDFAVNLKTAKAIGLKLPRSILLRATEVIE
jgi:putative ABC transport system substrate-binding protein